VVILYSVYYLPINVADVPGGRGGRTGTGEKWNGGGEGIDRGLIDAIRT